MDRPYTILNVKLMLCQLDTWAQIFIFLTANYDSRSTYVHPVQLLSHRAQFKDRTRAVILFLHFFTYVRLITDDVIQHNNNPSALLT